mgnify:CR=1 FL=1
MPTKPTLLDPLHLFELSLVDEPANIDSKVTIFKRDPLVNIEARLNRIRKVLTTISSHLPA